MSRKIVIEAGSERVRAELNDTLTAAAILAALPLKVRGSTWGDEIYFSIPVRIATERGQAVVEYGDLGYWEPGSAFCIFFGPTPASIEDEIRPASPVTVFGRCLDDPAVFKNVGSGTEIRVTCEDSQG